jgi:hypothetical protein
MALVKGDLIRDSGLSTVNGVKTIKRMYNVSSLPLDVNVLTAAETAAGVPQYGDPHPIYPFCIVRRIDVTPMVQGEKMHHMSADVSITYEGNDSVNVTFGSSLQQVMTDTNHLGKEMQVTFSGNFILVNGKKQLVPERAIVPKFVHNDFITFTHWYVVKNKDFTYPTPIEKLKEKYLNKVNSQTFRGKGKGVWMCTQFDGTSMDYGRSYEIMIKLERRAASIDPKDGSEDGWAEYAWTHNFDGTVPSVASKKKRDGVRKCDDLYDSADFNTIGDDLININSL